MTKSTPKEAVCTVFEKVNTGGVPLNVFELLTATFAVDGFKLNDDWQARQARLKEKKVLSSVESTDFLQTITLLASREKKLAFPGPVDSSPAISCKRKDILKLTLADYKAWADRAERGLHWSASFLANQRIFTVA